MDFVVVSQTMLLFVKNKFTVLSLAEENTALAFPVGIILSFRRKKQFGAKQT